jgi:acetyl-CoA carboxylase alpha subunit
MKNQLDFEKPIVELQRKLEELKKHPEANSMDLSLGQEIEQIERKLVIVINLNIHDIALLRNTRENMLQT